MSSPYSNPYRNPGNPYRNDDRADTATAVAATAFASNAVVVLAGAYTLYKVSELLGFPVRLWLHKFIASLHRFARMATAQLQHHLPARAHTPESSDGEDTSSSPFSMLSGAFGLNSGGIINKGIQSVTGALSKTYRNVPAGLGNWDNSCYQNSVIQGLASLPSLRDYLSQTTSEYPTLDADTTNGALFDLMNKLNDPEHHGQHFWIRGILKSMSTFQQQDAQEYYSKVLDALDNEVKKAAKIEDDTEKDDAEKESDQPAPSIVTPNPLDGLLAQRVGCVTCGYTEGLSLIPFNCITVPLGNEYNYDIGDCLDEYTSLEYIEGVECAKCTLLRLEKTLAPLAAPGTPFYDKIQAVKEALQDDDFDDKDVVKKFNMPKKHWSKSTKSRQAVVARAPKSLVIHVNRSIFDEMTGAQYKNNANVSYPRILDLGNWCLGTKPSNSQSVDEDVEETWPRDPKLSMIGGRDAPPMKDSPFQYALKAAVTHFGNHGSGHYVCYRQHPFTTADDKDKETSNEQDTAEEGESSSSKHQTSEDQWWRLSDESVHQVSEDEATHQNNVFMLFYERIDPEDVKFLSVPAVEPVEQSSSIRRGQGEIPVDPALQGLSVGGAAEEESVVSESEAVNEEAPPLAHASPPYSPTESLDGESLEAENADDATPADLSASSATTKEASHPEATTEDFEMTEASETADDESEGAPSTQLTSDDDVEMEDSVELEKLPAKSRQVTSPQPHVTQPHVMRTAGNSGGMADDSLPLVTAT